MAPLPPNNTAQLFFDYQQGTYEHTLMVRPATGATIADVAGLVGDFLTAIAGLIVTTTIIRARIQSAGADYSLPTTTPIDGDSFGAGTPNGTLAATFLTFVGRSQLGRRARLTVFGIDVTPPTDWRLTSQENSSVAAGVALLNGATSLIQGIDGTPVTWYNYANFGYNAYWQRNNRS